MAIRVNEANFETEVLKADIPVLVEFYSDSCIPCKQMSPIIGDLEEEYENNVKIVKVNVNFDEILAQKYGILASPTILFLKNGHEVNRTRGFKIKAQLEEILNDIL